jgi:hypothetical protein
MSKLTLDEAIKHCEEVAEQNETSAITYKNCKEIKANMYEKLTAEKAENDCRECAADHRQLAEWLTELKDLRDENKVLMHECDRLIKEKGELLKKSEQIAEYKRLLKAAVEDFRILGTMLEDGYGHCTAEKGCDECVLGGGNLADDCQWRHEAESLALIGEKGEKRCVKYYSEEKI